MANTHTHHLTVREAILKYAPNQRVAKAMLLGALLEGGTLGDPSRAGVGDAGHSRGPFQENDLYHTYDHTRITHDAGYAVRIILPSYIAASKKVPAKLWKKNPELAAERTAYLAERPARDYFSSAGVATVNAKWQAATGRAGTLQHSPFTLATDSTPISTGGGSSLDTWIAANIVLIVVVAVAILVLNKRK